MNKLISILDINKRKVCINVDSIAFLYRDDLSNITDIHFIGKENIVIKTKDSIDNIIEKITLKIEE